MVYQGIEMSHTICEAAEREKLSYLQRRFAELMEPNVDIGSKLTRLFQAETEEFDLDYAFFSRIDEAEGREHFEVVHAPDGQMESGDTEQLSRTYCRKTIAEPDGTMVVSDAFAEGWEDDPAYDRWGFDTYVGTTVTVEDELYGTLCFADTDCREDPIADTEVTLLEMFGAWATYEMNQWSGPPTQNTVSRALEAQKSPTSSELDNMMDALGKRPRRVILLELLDEPGDVRVERLEQRTTLDEPHTQLHHAHLPMLERAGYLAWDRERGRVTAGPDFEKVEPMLRILKHYTNEFSG